MDLNAVNGVSSLFHYFENNPKQIRRNMHKLKDTNLNRSDFLIFQELCMKSKPSTQKWRSDTNARLKVGFNISLETNLGPVEKAIKSIYKMVKTPTYSTYINEGESLTYHTSLIKLVNDVKLEMKPNLSNSTFVRNRFIMCLSLVKLILKNADRPELQERAADALMHLEKVFPRLNWWNNQIQQYIYLKDEVDLLELNKLLKKKIYKIKNASNFQMSIQKHQLPVNKPEYSLLFDSFDLCFVELSKGFWEDKQIYIGGPGQKACSYNDNLREVTMLEGLSAPQNGGLFWLRDYFILPLSNKILVPSPLCLAHSDSEELKMINTFKNLLDIEDRQIQVMGLGGLFANSLQKDENIDIAPFYFEGGNLIQTTSKENEVVYISGASNLLFSLLNSSEILSRKEFNEILNHANGNPNYRFDLLPNDDVLMERLSKAHFLDSISEDESKYIPQIISSILRHMHVNMTIFLGQVFTVGNVLENQPDFHLDMFMLPAPGGVVFLQDHSLCLEVLSMIECHYQEELSIEQIEEIELYKKGSIEALASTENSLSAIRTQLESYRFQVISAPGVFFKKGSMKVNFLNALLGKGDSELYCITNGSSGLIDHYLRDAFAEYMKNHSIENSYFIGRATEVEEDNVYPAHKFSSADYSLSNFGGLHCRTQAISKNIGEVDLSKFKKSSVDKMQQREYFTSVFDSFPILLKKGADILKKKAQFSSN